ncbi:hypothetical protein [Skermania piniformis]|uniref:Acetyl-CoA acetyltransferase n=1 Tax=Skermania pinensis TaxID=39122 RepID=A0ABX8S783_9ACTN|nr:hypothetical protein [Skermania piniformis]QXQ13704.1 acetyl-CoA acetyltransferase [Skermania piniformis]
MRRAAIVAPCRTPGGAEGGLLGQATPERLLSAVLDAVVDRSGIDAGLIEDMALAQPSQPLAAGVIDGVPATVAGLDSGRRRASGLQALITAAMTVQTGAADVVLAGGVEGGAAGPDPIDEGAVRDAEELAQRYAIRRTAADAFAAQSHRKAADAWQRGSFGDEVVPIDLPYQRDSYLIARDEGVRLDASAERLAELRPFVANGVVTTGNMSNRNVGASACLVVAEEMLDELGLIPMAYFAGWAAAGRDGPDAGSGAAPAVAKLLNKIGITLDDLDLVEINEGFAVEVLALLAEWDWDNAGRLNVNGSAISLGDPGGAAGLRIMTTMVHQLYRSGGSLGLEAISMGPDHGIAALFESAGSFRPDPRLVETAPMPRPVIPNSPAPSRRLGPARFRTTSGSRYGLTGRHRR